MRLLNATSLEFRDFSDESYFPPYVILSHTWEDQQEVTLKDMTSPYLGNKKGYSKITNTCRLARDRGIEWVWIDTCCIDKTNNTELTESINSMYRWYELAYVCIVYLVDFTKTPPPARHDAGAARVASLSQQDMDSMGHCVWFQRGWTLQELLAPADVEFYDATWTHFGSKKHLYPLLSLITRIPEQAIQGTIAIDDYSTAQRMAWASSRVTTKLEDAAYSLLGLFDVNLPLIYGEGPRAFQRLQEAILKTTTDMTLFGWIPAQTDGEIEQGQQAAPGDGRLTDMPLLASSPRHFQNCYDLKRFPDHDIEFSITNRGLRLLTYLILIPVYNTDVDRSTSTKGSPPGLATVPNKSRFMQDTLGGADVRVHFGAGAGLSGYGHDHSTLSRSEGFRYVLSIGRRHTKRSGTNNADEIGIFLRKTGPGQFIRECNPALVTMQRTYLQDYLNTTEVHSFCIALQPRGHNNMAVRPLVTASPGKSLRMPRLSGHKPPQKQTLGMFYHQRMLQGLYIPSLADRQIEYGNLPLQLFDERLRIMCLPESTSEVIALPCKSSQYSDNLLFSVLMDFRHGHMHPQCKVVDRSSNQFFFALSMRSKVEPIQWYLLETQLPDIESSSNTLWMRPAGTGHTYRIVATADIRPVWIHGNLLQMPTLDITITKATQSVR